MSKIDLTDTTSGYNLAKINENFAKVADAFNNKVLYRNNPIGEANQMLNNLDMNNNHIINLPAPLNGNEAARLKDVTDAIGNQATAVLTQFTPYGIASNNNVQGAIQQVVDALTNVPIKVLTTVAALRAHTIDQTSTIMTSGYYAYNDGGQAVYYRDLSDVSSADNGGSVIVDASNQRWKIGFFGKVNVKQWGCYGDDSHDDSVQMQRAFTFANSNKGTVYIPGGVYKLTTEIGINNSGQSTFPAGRMNIEGEGPQNSVLHFANGNYNGLSIIGSSTSIAATSMQIIKNLSVIKDDGNGFGLFLQAHAHMYMENVWCLGWNIGADMIDVQESTFVNLNFQYNVIGIHAERLNFTLPNALTFIGCTLGNSKQGGLDLINGNTLAYIGGSIESNNDLAGAPLHSPIWGARIICNSSAVIEGAASATFKGVYLERNGSATPGVGMGDIWYTNSALPSTLTVEDCTFNRGTTYSVNQIRIDTSGGFRHKINLSGNGHNAPPLGGYPGPSSFRPYIGITSLTDPITIIDQGNYYQDSLEKPDYSGTTVVPKTVVNERGSINGSARFLGASGTVQSKYHCGAITRTGTGTYTVAYSHTQPGVNNKVFSFMLTEAGVCRLVSENTTGAVFQCLTLAGAAFDPTTVMVSWTNEPSE